MADTDLGGKKAPKEMGRWILGLVFFGLFEEEHMNKMFVCDGIIMPW